MKNLQCKGTNSKAETLENEVCVALKSDERIGDIESLTYISHTPSDKDCGSIEEWETIEYEFRGHYFTDIDMQQFCRATINVKIEYDKETKKFSVEITNISGIYPSY